MLGRTKLVISEGIHKLNFVNAIDDSSLQPVVDELKTSGIYIMESFLPESVCDELVAAADEALEEFKDNVKAESEGSDLRIYGVDRLTDRFTVPEVQRVSDYMFKQFSFSSEINKFLLLGKITADPRNLGSGSGWHRDSPIRHQFKTLLFLSDVTEESGPFEYIVGSHRYGSVLRCAKFLDKSVSTMRFTPEEMDRLVEAGVEPKPTRYPAPKGTLAFVDTRGLHRGAPLVSGSRYALTNYYFSGKVSDHFFSNGKH